MLRDIAAILSAVAWPITVLILARAFHSQLGKLGAIIAARLEGGAAVKIDVAGVKAELSDSTPEDEFKAAASSKFEQ